MRKIILVILLLSGRSQAFPQVDFLFSTQVKSIDIPFEYHNDLIIVTLIFNRIFPLKFIFDTGAEQTILAQREITDMLHIPYTRSITILGSDLKTELTAYLATGVHLKLGAWVMPNRPILVLEEDYFRFEELTGLDIHGILGADLFRNFVVSINYTRKVITLSKANELTSPGKGYQMLPLQLHRGKPYLHTTVRIFGGGSTPVKLLLDSGASLGLVLYTNTAEGIVLPPHTIKGQLGMGLGGFLEGYVGRVRELWFAENSLKEVITNFQELAVENDTSLLFNRNGIIGNKILSRFYVVIDYPQQKLYLKPNRRFNRKFKFDRSGLVLLATGMRLRNIMVHDVIPGSPAQEAGIQKGDFILKVNFLPSSIISVESLYNLFSKRPGKLIRLKLLRNGERIKVQFRLRELV